MGSPSETDHLHMVAFLDRLTLGLQHAAAPVIEDAAFAGLRGFMAEIAGARARDGFYPSATAAFVMSFKTAFIPILSAEYSGSPERCQSEIKTLGDIVDQLAFLTFDAYATAREQVITRQNQAMLVLSTPTLRIWNQVVMMPLVGIIDTRRAQDIMEQLLMAISRDEAKVAILDVTAVPIIDTRVALHLTKVVAAARLLGAEVIVTGFSPEAAQTLVKLDIDLSRIRTRGTLRAGLAEALRFLGLRVGAIT